jgi:hypothetical protein
VDFGNCFFAKKKHVGHQNYSSVQEIDMCRYKGDTRVPADKDDVIDR